MILTLKGKISFTNPATTIKFDHKFEKGMTVITGENEKGKSLRVELIRFAWFGVPALRATKTQYQTVQVTCEAQFGADVYRVERTLSNAKLFKNDEQQAIGTTPVNAAIAKLFGYDLEVFDTANCCMQGEIQALTKMKPSERKRMVDRTIGLDAIDGLIKEVSDQISNQRKSIDLLEKRIDHSLVEPEKPDRYKESGLWEEIVEQLQDRKIEKVKLEQQIELAECEHPGEPMKYDGKSVQELTTLYEDCLTQQRIVERCVDLRQSLFRIEEVPYTVETLEQYMRENFEHQWHEYHKYKSYEKWAKKPSFPKEYIKIIEDASNQAELEGRINEIESREKVICPLCSGEFCFEHRMLDSMKKAINPNLNTKHWLNIEQNIKNEYKTFQFFVDAWERYEHFSTLPVIKEPTIPRIGMDYKVKQMIEALRRKAELTKLLEIEDKRYDEYKEKTQGHETPGVKYMLDSAKQVEEYNKTYDQKLEAWNAYEHTRICNEGRLAQIGDVDKDLAEAKTHRMNASVYEAQMNEYNTKVKVNARVQADIDVMKQELTDLLAVREGLNNIKPKVKSYLVPSLNRVASNLLSQMTNGKRFSIDIDEEFNIMVDGQVVETLSGSAKAATNLAIRIGLGTVLTKKVFSVFMADEIDESMNEERAAYTAECLRNLTKVFDQVFLVTHKDVQGDHRITL